MIQTVLFDIDGVLLSEERCFDASALSVWELLQSPNYLNIRSEHFTVTPNDAFIRTKRQEVFAGERVLSFMKSRGMNSNWDMVYLTFSYQLISLLQYVSAPVREAFLSRTDIDRQALKALAPHLPKDVPLNFELFVTDFEKSPGTKQDLLLYIDTICEEKLGRTSKLFSRSGTLWKIGQETYQEWYLGDAFIETSIGKKAYQAGKHGFLQEEIPLAATEELQQLFKKIRDQGIVIGIGTGRPAIESHEPLKALGLLDYIDPDRMVTATDVIEAERQFPEYLPLGKPHPYTYLHGFFKKQTATERVLKASLPLAKADSLLIIGDSLADCLAAQEIGAHFAAVLTGLTGEAAREEFEAHHAEVILSNVLEVERFITTLNTIAN
ncbi:haloacid dehalogenase [Pullulanibacillus camelliae]|uniref:Haloacid dehalogenase n=1 Tax=Pullulanibacillus camelliae TaxID=1707096 RepID=A0A8J2VSG2_9BACL|nr:HAD family hydrolase [Pullulanibacillus camelliae]GGE40546.1 haloacid dehalogenase [Pullulanibacillus camelliae]